MTIEDLIKYLPHKDIIKNAVVYMRRHYLSLRRWPKWWPFKAWLLPRVFLHLIKMPDDDRDPHDHPWPFWTLVLAGGYWEAVYETPDQVTGKVDPRVRYVGRWSRLYRPASHVHKIVKLDGPTWTLIVAGRRTPRGWGFWQADGSFVPEKKYLKQEDGATAEED